MLHILLVQVKGYSRFIRGHTSVKKVVTFLNSTLYYLAFYLGTPKLDKYLTCCFSLPAGIPIHKSKVKIDKYLTYCYYTLMHAKVSAGVKGSSVKLPLLLSKINLKVP